MTNPIDSLPATPETVGMPQAGDHVRCCQCGQEWWLEWVPTPRAICCDRCSYPDTNSSYDVEKVKP